MINKKNSKKSVKTNCNKMNAFIVEYKIRTIGILLIIFILYHLFCICECISILINTINYNFKLMLFTVYTYIAKYIC